jgi:hypothetical protein
MQNNDSLKLFVVVAMMSGWMSALATDYTYRTEGFEESVWSCGGVAGQRNMDQRRELQDDGRMVTSCGAYL